MITGERVGVDALLEVVTGRLVDYHEVSGSPIR